jgi:hypothetical protein
VFIKNTTFMNSYYEGISKDSNKTVTNDMSLRSLKRKSIFMFMLLPLFQKWAGTAQAVQQLTIGWTIQGLNPGEGEIFCTHPD